MILAGLDPGLHGALAVVDTSPWTILRTVSWDARKSTGNRRKALATILGQLADVPRGLVVVTEAVGARPQQGSSSTFGFGEAKGLAEGILAERGATFIRVAPSKWKRHLGLTADKRSSLDLARCWAPSLELRMKDHNTAEALLMTVWYALLLAHQQIRPSEAGKWGLLQ